MGSKEDTDAPAENKRQTVFVISPIGKQGSPEHHAAKQVLDYLIKKVFLSPQWEVIRADDESAPDSITTQVIDRIVNSDLIVADLTDHNPNVFYELAVAHGYQRPVIQIMKDGQSAPFDVVDQRVIFYDMTDPASVDTAKEALLQSADWLRDHSEQSRSPLTAHGKFTAISSGAPAGGANEAIADSLNEIVSRLSRLERTQREIRSSVAVPRNGRAIEEYVSSSGIRREPRDRALSSALLSDLEKFEGRMALISSRIDALPHSPSGDDPFSAERDALRAEFAELAVHRDRIIHLSQ